MDPFVDSVVGAAVDTIEDFLSDLTFGSVEFAKTVSPFVTNILVRHPCMYTAIDDVIASWYLIIFS